MGWRAPEFWTRRGLASALLGPAAFVYGAVASRRLTAPPRHRAGIPVVAVGNLVMGGAGKTPTVLSLADRIAAAGGRPCVVMRGYGGSLAGPVRVGPRHDADAVGDEAVMLASRGLRVVVARDRAAGVRFAETEGASHAILDDGFQSNAVAADLALLVVDAGYGLGNGRVFPAGPLRAPLAPQLAEADAVLAIGEGRVDLPGWTGPVLRGRYRARDPDAWTGRRLVGYAGIGRPEKFRATLEGLGVEVAAFRAFPDHQVLNEAEAGALLAEADRLGAGIVTTAKDRARLGEPPGGPLGRLAARSEVVEIDLVVEGDEPVAALLARVGAV